MRVGSANPLHNQKLLVLGERGYQFGADARGWVAQLLQRDPRKRLGMVGCLCGSVTFCYCCCSSFPLILLQARGGVSKLQAHPWFRHINWDDLKQGRATVPLGLRERVFKSAAMGDTSSWVPPQRGALTGSSSSRGNPPWLDEF